MQRIINLDLPYYSIVCVLGALCSVLLIFFSVLHTLEAGKGRKESGYENAISSLGCAAFVMFIFIFIAQAI